MDQLVERSLATPEVRGSNPAICKIDSEHLPSTGLKRRKKEKEAANGPLKILIEFEPGTNNKEGPR